MRATDIASWPWVDTLLDLGVGVVACVLAWFLFPGVASGIMGALLDPVMTALEGTHYGHLGPARKVLIQETVFSSVQLIATTLGLNLLLLPLYLVLIFIPPLNLVLFYLVNGQLLGREYFEAVALRRFDAATVAQMRQAYRWQILGAGAITTGLLTIPAINLVAPVIGAVAMVYFFHKLAGRV